MPWWVLALRLTGLGWYVAFCVIAGILGGYWLDWWLGTRFLFLLIGIVAGSGLAFYGVYRMVVPLLGQNTPPNSSGKREH
jgi:F0F1-type ATP synthase assembly protein I